MMSSFCPRVEVQYTTQFRRPWRRRDTGKGFKVAANLTEVSTHYEFGANWKDYSAKVDEGAIQNAETGLLKLVSRDAIAGKSFLDIGSGSGLHSLAALRLGAGSVMAIDIDPISIETTRALLEANGVDAKLETRLVSILAPEAIDLGTYDIVYSWGVLHHTGAMWKAIERAASHVGEQGLFVIAIYHKTASCWAWKIEKRIFTNGSSFIRSLIRTSFIAAFKVGLALTGRNPSDYIATYKGTRGMNFYNDVDDWLGGYPYESATESEVIQFVEKLGFTLEWASGLKSRLGLFGAPCSEFRFRR